MASRQRARHDDTTLASFELPSFAAGMAAAHTEQIRALAATGQPVAMARIAWHAEAVLREIREWQRMAAEITAYPFARRAP
jgi:hypothetical protein